MSSPPPRCGLLYGLLGNGHQTQMLSFRSNLSGSEWLRRRERLFYFSGKWQGQCWETRSVIKLPAPGLPGHLPGLPLPSPIPLLSPSPSPSERKVAGELRGAGGEVLQLHLLQAEFEGLRLCSRDCDCSLTLRSVSSCNALSRLSQEVGPS